MWKTVSRASDTPRPFTISAQGPVKQAEVAEPGPPPRAPRWLQQADLPVPLLPDLQARQLELRLLSYVASLVDGRRSIRDVARVLVEQRLMTAEEAEPTVRAFLARLHDEARSRALQDPAG